MSPLAMFSLSPAEIIGIILVGVVVFGGKLPDIARHVGNSLREFKQGMTESEDERRKSPGKDKKDDPPPAS